MLDRKFIVENAEQVRENCSNRGVQADVERLVELEAKRRALLQDVQELNRQAKEISKTVGKAKDDADRQARMEEGRQLRERKDAAQHEHDQLDSEILAIQNLIPNMSHPDAPIGADDKANLELKQGKTPLPEFAFTPCDHVELGEKLNLIDLEGGARTTGHGFYFSKSTASFLKK